MIFKMLMLIGIFFLCVVGYFVLAKVLEEEKEIIFKVRANDAEWFCPIEGIAIENEIIYKIDSYIKCFSGSYEAYIGELI